MNSLELLSQLSAISRGTPVDTRVAPLPVPLVVAPVLSPVPAEPRAQVQQLADFSRGMKVPGGWGEIRRIIDLPICLPCTDEEVDYYSRHYVQAASYNAGWRLREFQARAIREFRRVDGELAPLPVGGGKTLIALIIASIAYSERGMQRMVMSMPSSVYPQLIQRDLAMYRRHFVINVPFHLLGNRDAKAREKIIKARQPGCYLVPYSLYQGEEGFKILDDLDPGLLLLDEAQALKRESAARTQRVMHFIKRRRPQVLAESGTMTTKSIMDYHHLAMAALRHYSPLPTGVQQAQEWGEVLDTDANPTFSTDTSMGRTGPIMPLIDWAAEKFPDRAGDFTPDLRGFRTAYRTRLITAPGIVSTPKIELGVTLVLQNRPCAFDKDSESGRKLVELDQNVTKLWVTPDGDEIEHAIHTFKWCYELAAGFYYSQRWPKIEELEDKLGLSTDQATDLLVRALSHHKAKQEYNRLLRAWFRSTYIPGLDTPMLAGRELAKHGDRHIDTEVFEAWKYARSLEFDGMPERHGEPVLVDDFKLRGALAWIKSNAAAGRGGLVWYWNTCIGQWLSTAAQLMGIDVIHCPAGKRHSEVIIDPANANRIVIASINGHGDGKNLQHFQRAYYVQWPRPEEDAEQSLGRIHRPGQEADMLIVTTCDTRPFDHIVRAACLNDALYVHLTMSQRKIIYCVYDPIPTIFPPQVLREHGLENKMLTSEQQTQLRELFGDYSKN